MDLIETVTVQTHPRDVLPYLLTDPRLVRTTGVEDALWLRLLDIPAVLEARSIRGRSVCGAATFRTMCWAAAGDSRWMCATVRARCVPTDAAADVHTDLSVLGSLYMGTHRASAFATAAPPAVQRL